MFNGGMTMGPSLADIAAITNRQNDDCNGFNNGWWILILTHKIHSKLFCIKHTRVPPLFDFDFIYWVLPVLLFSAVPFSGNYFCTVFDKVFQSFAQSYRAVFSNPESSGFLQLFP